MLNVAVKREASLLLTVGGEINIVPAPNNVFCNGGIVVKVSCYGCGQARLNTAVGFGGYVVNAHNIPAGILCGYNVAGRFKRIKRQIWVGARLRNNIAVLVRNRGYSNEIVVINIGRIAFIGKVYRSGDRAFVIIGLAQLAYMLSGRNNILSVCNIAKRYRCIGNVLRGVELRSLPRTVTGCALL